MAHYFRRRKFCRFTAEGVKEIDYKDSKTRERIGKFLKDGEMYAHFKCNF